MPLITRLDSRTLDNSSLTIRDKDGEVVAEITTKSPVCELVITTKEGLHIEKPNGFSSRKE